MSKCKLVGCKYGEARKDAHCYWLQVLSKGYGHKCWEYRKTINILVSILSLDTGVYLTSVDALYMRTGISSMKAKSKGGNKNAEDRNTTERNKGSLT